MQITNDEKNELISMISTWVEGVHSDLEAAVKSYDPDATLEGSDFVEPVLNHLGDDAMRRFGNSHEITRAVKRYDRDLCDLVTRVAKGIVGR